MADSMFTNNNVPGPNFDPNWTNSQRMNNTGYSSEQVKASTESSITKAANDIMSSRDRMWNETLKQQSNDIPFDPNSFDIDESTMQSILHSANIKSPEELNRLRFNSFARYGILDIAHNHTGSREYLFFTKPDLHIFSTNGFEINKQLKDVTFFRNAIEQYPMSLLSLQQTLKRGRSLYPHNFDPAMKFIPLLSNHVTSSLDLPAISATETENNTSLFQVKTTYRDSSEQSDFGFDFSLEFWDTRYLDVYMLFKAYDEYCRQEFYRNVTPPKLSYITDRVNCKQFSIYKIIVDETTTIMFYGKATGVYPMGVPREAMSNFDGTIKITVPMKAQFVSDMDPIILDELNRISRMTYFDGTDNDSIGAMTTGFMPLYDKYNGSADTRWGALPYVAKAGAFRKGAPDQEQLYRLMWVYRSTNA